MVTAESLRKLSVDGIVNILEQHAKMGMLCVKLNGEYDMHEDVKNELIKRGFKIKTTWTGKVLVQW